MTTTHDDEQSRIVTTGEFPKCECCGRTFIGRNEVCIRCKKYVEARELAAKLELASSITTDRGDAYYQSIPIWRYAEQLEQSLKSQQQENEDA